MSKHDSFASIDPVHLAAVTGGTTDPSNGSSLGGAIGRAVADLIQGLHPQPSTQPDAAQPAGPKAI